MTRGRWTAEELDGHRLAWLVDLTHGGQTIRMATVEVDVDAGAGSYHYAGCLDDLTYQRSIDLFSLSAEPESIAVEGIAPADLPTLSAQGHRMEGADVQVSQVRIDAYTLRAVDAYEDRRVLLTGKVRDAEWGPYGNGGSPIRLSVERPAIRVRGLVPRVSEAVTRSTWRTTYLSDADLGVAYPLVIGYPGRDDIGQDGYIPAIQAVWLAKPYLHHVLCVGLGKVDASYVTLSSSVDIPGTPVNVSPTVYDVDYLTNNEPYDLLGQRVSAVDYASEGYYTGGASEIHQDYQPDIQDDADPVYLSYTSAGGGGMLWRGRVLRGAADVIDYMLDRARVPYEPTDPALNRYLIDAVIAERCNPLDWLREEVLPLVPVSLTMGEAGVRAVVWTPGRTAADATLRLDVDADPRIQPAERVQEDGSTTTTKFTLRYGYNARRDAYRYTRRIGPEAEASTDYATVEIRDQTPVSAHRCDAVTLTWRTAGTDGVGVTVTVTDTGVESAVYTAATRTLAVTYQSAASNSTSIAAKINASASASAVLLASAVYTGSAGNWGATSTPSVTMQIQDFGTVEHATPRRTFLATGEVSEEEIETGVVYDHGTADGILAWKAAAFGGPLRRISVDVPEALACGADLGDVATYTDSVLGFDSAVGTVEGIQEHSDGTTSVRVVFVD